MSNPVVPGAKWDRVKAEKFARDWNEGMPAELLREKYGVVNTSAAAKHVRFAFGIELRYRGPRGRFIE